MSDVQKLKDLLKKYHEVTTQKLQQGGVVKDNGAEKTLGEIIHFPGSTPEPKPTPAKAYSEGGEVVSGVGKKKDLESFARGMEGKSEPEANTPSIYKMTNAEDAVEAAIEKTRREHGGPAYNKGGMINCYDQGGQVSDDLAPYMPTKEEEEASGFPPGPQRAGYIAMKKKQAAEANQPQGYAEGGTIEDLINNNSSSQPTQDDIQKLLDTSKDLPQSQPTPQVPLPNNGLTGDDLAKVIAQSPGPEATTGNNLNLQDIPRNVASAPDVSDEDNSQSAPSTGPSKPNAIAQAIQQIAAQPQPNLDYSPDLNADALKAAQEKSATNSLFGNLGRASNTIGAAISKGAYKPDNSFWEDFQKNVANKPVENLLARRQAADESIAHQLKAYQLADEKEKNDPNSGVSQLARNVLSSSAKQIGLNIGDVSHMSASTVEKTAPWVTKLIDSQASIEQRKLASEERMALMHDRLSQSANKELNNRVTKLGDTLNPNKARAGQLATLQGQINSSDRLLALGQDPQGAVRNLNPQQMTELSLAVNRLISGQNGGNVESFKHLLPSSAVGNASAVIQWLTNQPTGANQQAFVKQMIDTANREKSVAQGQIKNAQLASIPALEHGIRNIRGVDKNDVDAAMNQVLQGYGITPEEYEGFKSGKRTNVLSGQSENPGSRSPQSSQYSPAQESGINAFMQGNKISDRNKAIQILKQAGKL